MHELIYKEFPVTTGRLCIKDIKIEELISIRHKSDDEEEYTMTCRPIVKRREVELEEFYHQILQNKNAAFLSIYTREGQELIGKVSFYDYNSRNKSIELGYYLIPEHRCKGYMEEALRQILVIIFKKAGIMKVYAQTASFNQASIYLLEKMLFVRDGVLRSHHELGGKYYDDYLYSLLASEWSL